MSDDNYSELTELSDEEEYEEAPKKKSKKAQHSGWRIRNALKVPRATTYTAQALYDQIYGCDINLEPEYQRDVVWSEVKQIGIIDSVFRNFYIPPVIFAVNVQDDGSETKTCIDGKQRLTSIHKFMEGLIPHRDPITSEKLWYKDIEGGGKRKLLPEKYRRIFANKQIVCVEYQDITDSDEREIFQRVQLGMALTPAEKLQVVKTPRTDFIRDLQNEYTKEDGWLGPKNLAWDVSRGSDFRAIAHAVCCMESYKKLKTLPGMPQLERWLSIKDNLKPAVVKDVEETYRLFADMVKDKKVNKIFEIPVKTSPVEFIGISILIYAHKAQATQQQLAAGIAEMREAVRDEHRDVRMNNRVTKTILDFIRQWDPKTASLDILSNLSSMKRKRKVEEDMDVDGDSDEAPLAHKAKKRTVNAEASTSKATPPPPTPVVKSEMPSSPKIAAEPPRTDRMAKIKEAKALAARMEAERAERAKQAPTAPRSLRDGFNPNPQMLPSPQGQYALPSNLVAAMNRTAAPPLPPPPQSAGSTSSEPYRGGGDYRDRAFDDDRAREKDRDRDRDRYPRGRDDRDRPRENVQRRDSGSSFPRPRSPPPGNTRWAPR